MRIWSSVVPWVSTCHKGSHPECVDLSFMLFPPGHYPTFILEIWVGTQFPICPAPPVTEEPHGPKVFYGRTTSLSGNCLRARREMHTPLMHDSRALGTSCFLLFSECYFVSVCCFHHCLPCGLITLMAFVTFFRGGERNTAFKFS